MAPIPKPQSNTVRAIYAAYEATNNEYEGIGISVGEVGTECDRALFYNLRWASRKERHNGQTVSIFRTGDRWEEVHVADLEAIGVEVYGQQDRIRLAGGHIRGKCDGKAMNVPEAPKTEHLCEFKSSNDKNFQKIVKEGCKKAQPKHYAQCQLGMHAFGLSRCLYLVSNKNDDARYAERIEYNVEYCLREIARCTRIIEMDEPPSRISDDPDFFGCMFCKHKPVCHEKAWPRVHCRTCLHSTPTMGGDADWQCSRWTKPLGLDEQRAGCPTHLFIPAMVPGEQIDCDPEAETVTYRLAIDGATWVDGRDDKRGDRAE